MDYSFVIRLNLTKFKITWMKEFIRFSRVGSFKVGHEKQIFDVINHVKFVSYFMEYRVYRLVNIEG